MMVLICNLETDSQVRGALQHANACCVAENIHALVSLRGSRPRGGGQGQSFITTHSTRDLLRRNSAHICVGVCVCVCVCFSLAGFVSDRLSCLNIPGCFET